MVLDEVSAPAVTVESVTKKFGGSVAVSDLSLSVEAGSFFALLGPSGCGKTTLMRLLAGFDAPDQGRIRVAGLDMAGVPPERRPVNMMFQSYALFPHMSVADNIAYGLRRAGKPRTAIASRVEEMLAAVQLAGLETRKPDALSGGQRQRVALARALARGPKILLLDEPMAALDRKLREETQWVLKDIQRRLGTTFIIVTHDQDEALGLADTVALMRAGRIEQIGSPADLYERPRTSFAARFIGEINIFEGVVRRADNGHVLLDTADGPLIATTTETLAIGTRLSAVVRPERLAVETRDELTGDNVLSGRVQDATFRGATTLLRVRLPSGRLLRAISRAGAAEEGATVQVRITPGDLRLLRD